MEKRQIQQLSGCYCLQARRNSRAITRVYDRYLRQHGLRATQFSVLAALAGNGEVPLGKLADFLGMERTTLTRSTALLEARGWIRSAEGTDARLRPLTLTTSGKQKLEKAYSGWKAAQAAIEEEFPELARAASR